MSSNAPCENPPWDSEFSCRRIARVVRSLAAAQDWLALREMALAVTRKAPE